MNQATQAARPPAARGAAVAPSYERPPYLLAALAGLVVFALYALTLGPTTWFWDTSEYITVAHILGIPHPPGNPLFVLLAGAWARLLAFTGLDPAVRVNLFSAFMSASTAALWFLVVHRVLAFFTTDEWVRRVGAATAVLISATAFTVWFQSTVNEKVYTVSLLTIALLSWWAFLWRDHVEKHRTGQPAAGAAASDRAGAGWHDDNVLVAMVFVLALSVGNHLMAFLAAPALLVMVLLVKPRVVLNWRLYAAAAVVAVLGLSVHLFLPIRAELNPIINEAAPTCGPLDRFDTYKDALVSIITFGRAGCENLSEALAREQYAKPPVTMRQAPFYAQLLNYFQYFDWQWARSIQGRIGYFAPGRLPITLLFTVLGIFGAVQHYKKDRTSFAYLATLFGTLSFGLIFYLNFKYGYAQVQAWNLDFNLAEVRERDYFFLVSFSMWGLWVGIGLTALWLRLSERFAERPRARLLGAPVLALAFIPLVLNWSYASRRGDYSARDWAYNLLMSVEPYGVLFTNGDNDTFPLWYLQEVEGIRRDVTVMVWSYLNTPWYAQQIRELTKPCPTPNAWAEDPTRILCQRPFEPEQAPLYGTPPAPTKTILPLTDAQILAATNSAYAVLPQDMVFEANGLQVTLPANTMLAAADQFILTIIKEAWGDRPVYFAATTNRHRELGMDEHTARQGVAYKLVEPTDPARAGLVPLAEDNPYRPVIGSHVDVERMRRLLGEVFVHRSLLDAPHWPDDATRGIPTYYAYAHLALAQAEASLGNQAEAERHVRLAERWMELAER